MSIEELCRSLEFQDPPDGLRERILLDARRRRGGGFNRPVLYSVAFAVAVAGFAVMDHTLQTPAPVVASIVESKPPVPAKPSTGRAAPTPVSWRPPAQFAAIGRRRSDKVELGQR